MDATAINQHVQFSVSLTFLFAIKYDTLKTERDIYINLICT